MLLSLYSYFVKYVFIDNLLKKTRKYLLFPLVILLVLSNFSFATSLMICSMTENSMKKCSCSQNDEETASTLQIEKVTTSCCENRTIELNNSNTLQKVTNEVTNLVQVLAHFVNIFSDETSLSQNNHYSEVNEPPPKFLTDIPINNSSLLI